jgi:amino acid permease
VWYRAWCEAVFLVYKLQLPALCTEIETTDIAEEYIGTTLGALLTLIIFVTIVNSSQRL